ncbi:MAG: LPD7 domain-containing protein [Sulfuricurvum sp.]|nr:LPD7 domain-containing protein [Sulfuricurvum sp.]
MLIRITGGNDGIAEYLVSGQKHDREMSRDELDERVVLDGDLDLTDTIIKGMDKEGERYLHITLAFKEDVLTNETLKDITGDFKAFSMTAYDADEFNFYAEAHLPKIKSYTNRQTGELVERKPHIHIVIPEKNLLTGQNLNPFGKVDQQTKFLEAFQEHVNAKYGLASPKDNRRIKFTSESEIISRYKGDLFQGNAKALKERILSDVLDRQIGDYDSFKALLAEHGATRTRNAGKENEYQNVKLADQAKGINLKEYVFSREFIEKPEADKRLFLADEGRKQYDSQQVPRVTAPELTTRLKEWHEVRAPELKYINSGNRKLYADYRNAVSDDKKAILADRATAFYSKHRENMNERERTNRGRYNGSNGVDGHATTRDNTGSRFASWRTRGLVPGGGLPGKPNIGRVGRKPPPQNKNRLRSLSELGVVRLDSGSEVLLPGDVPNHLEQQGDKRDNGLRRDVLRARVGEFTGHEVSQAEPQPRDTRSADNVTGQLAAEQRERMIEAKAATLSEFTQIKRELDAGRLLAHLSKTHGVIPEKYQVTKGKDGGDRIKAGSRNLNVSDFLTQEVRLSFSEAAPILRKVYADQVGREVIEARAAPRRELWEAFRAAQPDQAKLKAKEWEAQRQGERERRAQIRDAYQVQRRSIKSDKRKAPVERKAALSIASMKRVTEDMALRETMAIERKQLKERQSYQERYRAFLAERANTGDEAALAELRRQRGPDGMPEGANNIESSAKRSEQSKSAPIASGLAYSIDRSGNVTYYADATKSRALVIDSGKRVTVAAAKDSLAVEASLRLAVQKFGPTLKVDGSKEFQNQLIEAAFKTGLRVEFSNPDMNAELQRQRAEREDLQARGKAFIEAERRKATVSVSAPLAPTSDITKEKEPGRDNQQKASPQDQTKPRKPRGPGR